MSRPKLNIEDKKITLGITISRDINVMLGLVTNNKSKFIENILMEHLKKFTISKDLTVKWIEGEYNGYIDNTKIEIKEK